MVVVFAGLLCGIARPHRPFLAALGVPLEDAVSDGEGGPDVGCWGGRLGVASAIIQVSSIGGVTRGGRLEEMDGGPAAFEGTARASEEAIGELEHVRRAGVSVFNEGLDVFVGGGEVLFFGEVLDEPETGLTQRGFEAKDALGDLDGFGLLFVFAVESGKKQEFAGIFGAFPCFGEAFGEGGEIFLMAEDLGFAFEEFPAHPVVESADLTGILDELKGLGVTLLVHLDATEAKGEAQTFGGSGFFVERAEDRACVGPILVLFVELGESVLLRGGPSDLGDLGLYPCQSCGITGLQRDF